MALLRAGRQQLKLNKHDPQYPVLETKFYPEKVSEVSEAGVLCPLEGVLAALAQAGKSLEVCFQEPLPLFLAVMPM